MKFRRHFSRQTQKQIERQTIIGANSNLPRYRILPNLRFAYALPLVIIFAGFGMYSIFFSQAAVSPTQVTFENGSTSACNGGVNTTSGNTSFTPTIERAYEGTYSAKASYTGGTANAYARCVVTTNWTAGDDVWYGTAIYLPTGFTQSIQNQVDLMRWDNFSLNNTSQDWGGIIIQNNDKKARLKRFNVSNDYVDLSPTFTIPEGKWVWLEVRQKFSATDGQAINEVYMDNTLIGSSTTANMYGKDITRIRYGLVAIGAGSQTNPLELWVDRATISTSKLGPVASSTGQTANLWIDTNGGSCIRSATATVYSDSTACSSIDQAWDKATAGDTIRMKAGNYPYQYVTGHKTSETKIIGETGTKIVGTFECKPEYGTITAFCADANFMTLENVTIDSQSTINPPSGSLIIGSNVTYRNVNLYGEFVSMYIKGPNFTWQGGSHGQDGVAPPDIQCETGYGEPVWIDSAGSGTTLDGIRFNPKTIKVNAPTPGCPDGTPHLENVRIQGASNVTTKNSWFLPGSDAGSGHIFAPSSPGLKLINNVFDPVNGSYNMQLNSTCDAIFAYNTFTQGNAVYGCEGGIWVGNLGVGSPGCTGTNIKNVWSGSGSCASDKFVGSQNLGIGVGGKLSSSSPAINAAETDSTNDYCTGALVGFKDREGNTRPQGTACDAGAFEYTGTVISPDTTPPDTTISTSTPANGVSSSTPSASISFTGTDNVTPAGSLTYECSLDSTTTYSTCTSPKSYSSLTVGSHTIRVRAKDVAGNTDQSPASITFTITTASTCSTKQGDANNDNSVNILDIQAILRLFGQPPDTACSNVYVDPQATTQIINIDDLKLILTKYGT